MKAKVKRTANLVTTSNLSTMEFSEMNNTLRQTAHSFFKENIAMLLTEPSTHEEKVLATKYAMRLTELKKYEKTLTAEDLKRGK